MENDINDIKIEWKIPNSKLKSFNCEWTEDSVNPFPFILRKSQYINGYYVVGAIIFNDLKTARYQRCRAYEREKKSTLYSYPYSDWYIESYGRDKTIITTDLILKNLNMGFKWIHIDETVEWYMDMYRGSVEPCWITG